MTPHASAQEMQMDILTFIRTGRHPLIEVLVQKTSNDQVLYLYKPNSRPSICLVTNLSGEIVTVYNTVIVKSQRKGPTYIGGMCL